MSRRPDFPAGKLPPGAKMLETKLPKGLKRRPCPPFAPGDLLAAFVVEGRPVPWSVPVIAKNGGKVKSPRLVAWQEAVKRAACLAWDERYLSYRGPVRVVMHFHLARRGAGLRGNPDTTNLQKGAEDSLQGAMIANDCQVDDIRSVRFFDGADHAAIWVYAAGGETP